MSEPIRHDDVRTIGVAIAIPPPFGPELQRRRDAFGDPMADAIPPHVTLLPPTEVSPDELPVITKHLSSIAANADPFEIHLRGTATFRPVSPVVFVALARGISHCEMMASAVRTGPLTVDLHFPYHPHVTVAHNLEDEVLDRAFAELADYEAAFSVTAFGLYEHREDGYWVERRSFPLGARRPVPGERRDLR
ncbi:MAG TPA: 2'-5' RNA ligase family protein [Jiangellaceae bacterium]|nr:2'-5' RNA ligase family protein [Jiangellaceae bacterium]